METEAKTFVCCECQKNCKVINRVYVDEKALCKKCVRELTESDELFTCEHCDELHYSEDSRYIENYGRICEDCWEHSGSFSCCCGCGTEFHENDLHYNDDGDGYCNSCWEDEDHIEDDEIAEVEVPQNTGKYTEPLFNKAFLLKTDQFRCEEEGDIIKSKRTFGIEVEALAPDSYTANELAERQRRNGYSFTSDGSIEGSGFPLETQTPVFQGSKGEKEVYNFFKLLHDYNFTANSSCGQHIHIGLHDLVEKHDDITILTGHAITIEKIKSLPTTSLIFDKKAYKTFGFSKDFLSKLTRAVVSGGAYEVIGEIKKSEYWKPEYETENFSLYTRYPLIRAKNENEQDYNDTVNVYSFRKESGESMTSDDLAEKLVIISKKPDVAKFKALRGILYAYKLYEDILFSMVDDNRQQNHYCGHIPDHITLADISQCANIEDVEKLWYGVTDSERRKRNGKYDDSRYCAINLHTFFRLGSYGTIEIRLLGENMEADVALNWIALHQLIVDTAVDNGYEYFANAKNELNLSKKFEMFCKHFSITKSMRAFIEKRIVESETNGELIRYITGK